MPDYKGEVKYLRNRDIIDLGGRSLEVYFTPGHTPGSVTFLEKGTEYGYCGHFYGSNFVTEERIRFVEKAVSRLKNGELEVTPFDGVFNLNRMALCDGYKIRFVGVEQL